MPGNSTVVRAKGARNALPGGSGRTIRTNYPSRRVAAQEGIHMRHHWSQLLISVFHGHTVTMSKKGTRALIELHSTAGLMAGIVYGGDIQSIGTDH